MNTPPSPFKPIEKFFPIIERVSLAAFAVGFILKSMGNPIGNSILVVALSALSVIYFLQGQIPLEIPSDADAEPRVSGFNELLPRTIVPKVLGIGSSITVVGIQFALLNWTGFRQMLLIGTSSLVLASAIVLISSSKEEVRSALQPRLIRAILLVLVGAYLLWVYGIVDPVPYAN